jgi:renalase
MAPMTETARVAIIGAGLAGLSCARRLNDAGWSPAVFEKSRGPGGRMSTRRLPDRDDWQCDHGAQYFTATHPDFVTQTAQWLDAGVAAVWQAKLHVFGPRTHSHKPAPDGWYVQSESGPESGPFDWLILAIPAQQAEALLISLGDTAVSDALLTACRQIPLQPCWALMAELASPLGVAFDAAFVNRDPTSNHAHVLGWMARDSSKPGRPGGERWVLHASAAWSVEHLEADSEQVGAAMLEAWAHLLGEPPRVLHWQLHRWRYARQPDATTGPGCVMDAQAQMGLCGDWLQGGRVEGAWLSGQQLAHRLLDCTGQCDTVHL